MKKHFTKKEREEHLEQWRREGMSKNRYAIKAGINPRTFLDWTWRDTKEQDRGFVEISKKMFSGGMQEIVIEKGSFTVRVPLTVCMKDLQAVFGVLGGLQ